MDKLIKDYPALYENKLYNWRVGYTPDATKEKQFDDVINALAKYLSGRDAKADPLKKPGYVRRLVSFIIGVYYKLYVNADVPGWYAHADSYSKYNDDDRFHM